MPQLSLYLDSDTMNMLRTNAAQENISLSKYVSSMLQNNTGSAWPKGYWDIYGALEDTSFVVPDEQSFDKDTPRPLFD